MVTREEIQKLASLSRIAISEEEIASFTTEIDEILQYVGQITSVVNEAPLQEERVMNVMREDKDPHESGLYTDKILKEAPDTENGYIRVKRIL